MTILITAAGGQLGRLTIHSLLERGVPATDIVAGARDLDRVADLAELGVTTRHLDYDSPATVRAALAGVDKVLLISSNGGERATQHGNVIDAAREAGVALLAYTSVLKADTATFPIAVDHQATEKLLAESTVPHVLLRNGWYLENYTDTIDAALGAGAVFGSSADGVVNGAARRDYADAAAAVLTEGDHTGRTYELAGDHGFTMTQYAAAVSAAAGREIPYTDLPQTEYAALLARVGVPVPFNEWLADTDRAIRSGELADDSGDLARLIGRPTTPLDVAVRAAVG